MNNTLVRAYLCFSLLFGMNIARAQMEHFDIQGHRGCRGLLPENTLPAFEKAIELGVTTLEMDVVLSGDNTWFVSHEPWLNHQICTDIEGRTILAEREQTYNLYRWRNAEIQACDCGSMGHPGYPEQKATPLSKPTLEEVLVYCEQKARALGREIRYNIEIKSHPDWEGIFQPPVDEYVDFFTDFMDRIDFTDRITVQSFDMRVLRLLNEQRPEWTLALLTDNLLTVKQNVKALGFTPEIYSPRHTSVHKLAVKACRELDMKLIPWTVNDPSDMQKLIELGVDGIITDYPDRLIGVVGRM